MITPLQLHAAELAEVYHVPLEEEKKQQQQQASEATEEKAKELAQEEKPLLSLSVCVSAGPAQSSADAAPELASSQSQSHTEQPAPGEKLEQSDASAAKSAPEPEPEAGSKAQAARSGAGDSYRCALQLSYVLEVLTFCAEHHAHTATFKNFLIGRNFLPKCLPSLFHSRHTFLLLGALRSSTVLL